MSDTHFTGPFPKVTMNPFSDSSEKISTMEAHDECSKQTLLLQTDEIPPISSRAYPTALSENDKTIFDELKRLIYVGEWEKLVEKLLEFPDFPIDAQSSEDQNYTLLHHAAERKNADCLRVLVTDFSAKPNIKADNGWTPMHLLVISDCRCEHCTKKTLDSLQILVDIGAHVDSEDDIAGETPLYYAARNRLSKPAEFLLNNGANINHWVNDTSVATLLAQYVPDVLKREFDKSITIHEKDRMSRGLRLDFRLLLQYVAIHEGFTVTNASLSSRGKRDFPGGLSQRRLKHEPHGKLAKRKDNEVVTLMSIPPEETELLNYLLRADLAAVDAVVNHPFVEAFVHLKWLTVRKVFLFFRSLYLFLIALYTFYVFDTFVNVTCFYQPAAGNVTNETLSNTSFSTLEKVRITGRDNNETLEKARFGVFFPTASSDDVGVGSGEQKLHASGYAVLSSFSQYFKAHEMACDPTLRTTILAYLFAVYAICTVLYELYKLIDGRYAYVKDPLNFAWWVLAVNIGISLSPGLNIYAHTWHYPHAAFTLIYGWILVLAQIERIPYFGTFVGIFVKVVKDFCLLLLTFSPVLLAFALGFSVMLPHNEFFRYIPLGLFKVFLMMTGDLDFLGVFSGTWTASTELKGHVHFPLFVIYSAYILMVTMVLMSLLLGLAVDNIQEVRREAALIRTVRLIQEIGIFESILHNPALYYCGCSRFFRRLFSITSLDIMNGSELITFPEDPYDTTLPASVKQKLVPYLLRSCCCSKSIQSRNNLKIDRKLRKAVRAKGRNKNEDFGTRTTRTANFEQKSAARILNNEGQRMQTKSNDVIRRQFFEANHNGTQSSGIGRAEVSNSERAHRDLMIYKEIKLMLEDNEKTRIRLETLQKNLISRKY